MFDIELEFLLPSICRKGQWWLYPIWVWNIDKSSADSKSSGQIMIGIRILGWKLCTEICW